MRHSATKECSFPKLVVGDKSVESPKQPRNDQRNSVVGVYSSIGTVKKFGGGNRSGE